MAEAPTSFSDLLAGYGTVAIAKGMRVESVFTLLKVRGEDGSPAWMIRSGGAPLMAEELVGVLDGLTTSMRQRLMKTWKRALPPPNTGGKKMAPMQFSELLAGLETVGLGDEYLIESVFAVIKAVRVDGAPVWHVRSSEMKLSPEERLGALEGYASAVRQELADKWKW
jgi:hypothetical protein